MNFVEVLYILILFLMVVLALAGMTRNAGWQEVRLARLERKVNLILEHLGVEDDAPTDGVQDFILRGQKIQAIKLYREQHPVGLKEAKDAVEQIESELRAGLRS